MAGSAHAQSGYFYLDRAQISGAPDDGFMVWRPYMSEKTRFYANAILGYSHNPLRNDTVTNDPTARLPDSDRWWATVGSEYRWTPNWKFDVGFAYIWVKDPEINQNAGNTAANGLLKGNYTSNVQILSAQLTYSF